MIIISPRLDYVSSVSIEDCNFIYRKTYHKSIKGIFNGPREDFRVVRKAIPVWERQRCVWGEGVRELFEGVVDVNYTCGGVQEEHGEDDDKDEYGSLWATCPAASLSDMDWWSISYYSQQNSGRNDNENKIDCCMCRFVKYTTYEAAGMTHSIALTLRTAPRYFEWYHDRCSAVSLYPSQKA